MKVSLVIPVYNEADHLAACLEAAQAQTVPFFEVIVVDNNSTDGTAAIAESFEFVRLLREPRQGVVHARNRGFNAARGDVIARIDADTLLPPEWVSQVLSIFKNKSIAAVSGAPQYYDFGWERVANAIDWRLRGHLARKLGNTNFLWGANMAMRRSAWLKIRRGLCAETYMHEDFDLGLHLQFNGFKVAYDELLLAGVSSRRIDTGFRAYVHYTLRSPHTYARHHLRSRHHMYPVLFVCWLAYLPGRLIYRAYDPATGDMSFNRLLAATTARVDPTTNVI